MARVRRRRSTSAADSSPLRASAATAPPRPIRRIDNDAEARAFAAQVLETTRARLVCVISTPLDDRNAGFDADAVAAELGDVCEVVVLPTGTASRAFQHAMPNGLQVFGGAARVYPLGSEWTTSQALSPLRFPSDTALAARQADLVADGLRMAAAADLFRRSSAPSTAPQVRGTVRMILPGGSRAVVELDGGGVASVVQERVGGVALDGLLRVGMAVTGALDAGSGALDLVVPEVSDARLREAFPDGTVTAALVCSVQPELARLALHPGQRILVSRGDVSPNPHDRLDVLLEEGDVVAARVLWLPSGAVGLRLLDIDDDEPVTDAVALLPGGPPWIAVPTEQPYAGAAADDAAVLSNGTTSDSPTMDSVAADLDSDSADPFGRGPAAIRASESPASTTADTPGETPAPASTALRSTQLQLEAARARIRALELQLAAADAAPHSAEAAAVLELAEALRANAVLKDQLGEATRARGELRQQLRNARRSEARTGPEERRSRFASDEEWVRHELYLAWVERVEAGERSRYPLPVEFGVGDRFAESLRALDDGQFEKACRTAVDVLVGRAGDIPSREVHALHRGTPSAPPWTRPNGDTCMRCYIEQKSPSARRLHYWLGDRGRVELSRVVQHDDFTP